MKNILITLTLMFLSLSLARCGSSDSVDLNSSTSMEQNLGWYGDNLDQLQEFLASSHGKNPVAVFDWDNTILYRDIGDATLFWMINHNKIHQPKNKDWSNTSPLLTTEAKTALKQACDNQGFAEGTLMTDQSTEGSKTCSQQILMIYSTGFVDGEAEDPAISAFDEKLYDKNLYEPAYAWAVQLQAGYTPDEIREFARSAFEFNSSTPLGTQQNVGRTQQAADARLYTPMKNLIKTLHTKGFDVWVSSASSQYIVDAIAEEVGIDSDHVIGVRPVIVDEKITARFEGCGSEPDNNSSLINYRFGKRCWLNKEVFEVSDPNLQLSTPGKQVFSAGDSDTDMPFVQDASGLHLVINRNKKEIMCHAYANEDGKWIINPRFIKPLPQKDPSTYSCAAYNLPDQEDTVFIEPTE